MKFKGKGIALSGTIISLVVSFLVFILGAIYNFLAATQTFKDSYIEGFLEGDSTFTTEDALATLDILKGIVSFFEYTSLIYMVLGIIALVLIIVVKKSNVKGIGIYLLLLSILHLFSARLLVFVLLLIGSINFLQYKEEIQNQEVKNEPVF
ncbi:MAG: hypothetical protein K0Q49_12 [Haloplasmataceae bacterium]|jgi:hypothetical protein|nr:hypothetical protein [Haloplasmataceae bacterium]